MPRGQHLSDAQVLQDEIQAALASVRAIAPTFDSYPRLPGVPSAADIVAQLQNALASAKAMVQTEADLRAQLKACSDSLIVANGKGGPPVAAPVTATAGAGVSPATTLMIGLAGLGVGAAGGYALGKKKR